MYLILQHHIWPGWVCMLGMTRRKNTRYAAVRKPSQICRLPNTAVKWLKPSRPAHILTQFCVYSGAFRHPTPWTVMSALVTHSRRTWPWPRCITKIPAGYKRQINATRFSWPKPDNDVIVGLGLCLYKCCTSEPQCAEFFAARACSQLLGLKKDSYAALCAWWFVTLLIITAALGSPIFLPITPYPCLINNDKLWFPRVNSGRIEIWVIETLWGRVDTT